MPKGRRSNCNINGNGRNKGPTKEKISPMKTLQCTYCNDRVDEQVKSIECFVCKHWCHFTCTDLKISMFNVLSQPEEENLLWMCDQCKADQKEIKSRNDVKMDKLLELVYTLTTRMEKMEAKLRDQKELEEHIEEVVERKVEEKLEEMQEIEKRKKNIVIVNMKESAETSAEEKKADDVKKATELIKTIVDINENELTDPIRLGKEGGTRHRMLKLTVKNEEKKKEIMKKASELNKGKAQSATRIYINQDLTKTQREKHKALRDELKERKQKGEENIAIRNWKIVTLQPRDKDATAEKDTSN